MKAENHTIGFRDLMSALKPMLPTIPAFLQHSARLGRMKRDDVHSIGLLLEEQAAQRPHHPALSFEDRRWTYAEFNAWVNQLAHLFKNHGVRAGDCVAIMFENRPEVLACMVATVKLGAIAGMLNHHQRGDVLAHSICLVNPRLAIVGQECQTAMDEIWGKLPSQPLLFWDGEGKSPPGYLSIRTESAWMSDANPVETASVKLGQPCYYAFTSGTTGLPKAAAMTHLRWCKASVGIGQMSMRLRGDDILYCPLPLYHNNGLNVAFGAAMRAGATLALARKFSTTHFWDDIRRHKATSFIYIGELCRYLLAAAESPRDREHNVRVIVGNGLRPEIWDRFQQRFGIPHICEFYGASECNVAFVNGFNLKRTAGFCPLAYAVIEYDVDNDQPLRNVKGYMRRVKPGGVGLLISEVTERSPYDGYTDSQASEAKLLRNVFRKGDVWFNTGDLVRNQGMRHIAFVDRLGDTFRWKGENVATTEIEGILQCCPGIAEAVVYGVQIPNTDGRAGMASITLQAGSSFDPQAICRHLFSFLPGYAVPLFLRLSESQEVTTTFKLRKVELKQQAYDPARTDDPLYVLLDRQHGYDPLTPEIYSMIQNGSLTF